MALTASTMLPLGTPLPLAAMQAGLTPVCGGPLQADALDGRPVLVLFISVHCPFVKHVEPELSRLGVDLADRVAIIAIGSNSVLTHPQDGPEGMRAQAAACGWSFPYLHDADQTVAHAFGAACTPDLYLFDADHRLAYRGQLDDSRPGNDRPVDGRDLRAAVTAVLAGGVVAAEQLPSIGCSIKWHPERQP